MSDQKPTPRSAGAFDIRNVIGALLGIYGIILVICNFVIDPGVNPDGGTKNAIDNLWAGLAMLAVSIGLIVWAKLAPIIVPTEGE